MFSLLLLFAPDGQGIAIRLAKQVALCNKRLKRSIHLYNDIEWPAQNGFPANINFQGASDPTNTAYYSCLDQAVSVF